MTVVRLRSRKTFYLISSWVIILIGIGLFFYFMTHKMPEDNNKNFIERLKEFWEGSSPNKKLALIGMAAALIAGIVFLILGNSTYFLYSAVCVAVLHLLTRNA